MLGFMMGAVQVLIGQNVAAVAVNFSSIKVVYFGIDETKPAL